MGSVVIIGAGGVGNVVAHKCAHVPEVFEAITLASRTRSKCERIAEDVRRRTGKEIATAQVDADRKEEVIALLRETRPDLVINVALPYQDLPVMEACLEAKVHYVDTANYEPPDTAHFEYSWQWAYHERFMEAGLTALLGSGFDPGVTNVFTAWIAKHILPEIRTLDIVDVNGGDHGHAFATNFNPEINIREVTAPCRHWENGGFVQTPAMATHAPFVCPGDVGAYRVYRMYHEELESLTSHFPTLRRASFWMSFSENYLKHLEVLQNVGMTRIDPVMYQGVEIVPLQFLKAVLPEPSGLGETTRGKTCIGVIAGGPAESGGPGSTPAANPGSDGTSRRRDPGDPDATRHVYVYNVCDHQEAFREVGSQAISYTTGVPAMIGAGMILKGHWRKPGVWNMEQFDPDPFMDDLQRYGLPWTVQNPAAVTIPGEE